MDPLTHTATGLFLSRAGLHRLTPRATPILLLAANAPDIDIVAATGGALNYLHYHRHLTHSLVAAPVMAIAPVILVWAVTRGALRWPGAFVAALAAVASHLLLDWTNVYGIRLLLPFSSTWLRLDLTPIVDLAIWGAFLVCLVGPFLARLVTSEITSGKPHKKHHGRGFAWLALAFLLLYNGGRGVLQTRAVAFLDSHLYEGEAATRVAALATLNPLTWRGLIETRDFYQVQEIDLAGVTTSSHPMIFYKPAPSPAINTAAATPTFRIFLGFSQFPLWRVTPVAQPENGQAVEVFDMRFGTPLEPGFMAGAVLDGRGRVVSTTFQFGVPRPR